MKSKRQAIFCDADGEEHSYTMILFGASKGIELAPVVVTCLSEPIGQVLNTFKAFAPSEPQRGADGEVMEPAEEPGLVSTFFSSDFDAHEAGKAVSTLAQKVIEAGGPDFVMKLLSDTHRDGKPLRDKTVFDPAFQGNYMELLAVVGWVLTENFASAIGRMRDPFVQGFRTLAKSLAGFKPLSSAQP